MKRGTWSSNHIIRRYFACRCAGIPQIANLALCARMRTANRICAAVVARRHRPTRGRKSTAQLFSASAKRSDAVKRKQRGGQKTKHDVPRKSVSAKKRRNDVRTASAKRMRVESMRSDAKHSSRRSDAREGLRRSDARHSPCSPLLQCPKACRRSEIARCRRVYAA